MQYKIGKFVLDNHRNLLLLADGSEVSDSHRIVQAFSLMAARYPNCVRKEEFIAEIWPDSSIGESSLSRLTADLRKLLTTHDAYTDYVKTVHKIGFKLVVPPLPLETETDHVSMAGQEKETTQAPKASLQTQPEPMFIRSNKSRLLIASTLCTTLGIGCYVAWNQTNPDIEYPNLNAEGKALIPARTEEFSLTKLWWASGDAPIIFDERGVSIATIDDQQLLSYHIEGPVNAYRATLIFQVEIDQTYKDSGASLQVFAQSTQRSWPGEWNCAYYSELSVGLNTISCQIDEPEAIFYLAQDVQLRTGIRYWGSPPSGLITIKHGEAKYLPSAPIDSGWQTNAKNQTIQYDNGVHFYPESRGDRLFFYAKGPLDLEGKTMHFAFAVDQDLIDSLEYVQIFAQSLAKDSPGVWTCFVDNKDLLVVGDTYHCKISSGSGAFNLAKDELVHFGVHVEGRKPKGKLSVLGVNFE